MFTTETVDVIDEKLSEYTETNDSVFSASTCGRDLMNIETTYYKGENVLIFSHTKVMNLTWALIRQDGSPFFK